MWIIGKQLRQHIILSVLGQQFQIRFERLLVQLNSLHVVIQEKLIKRQVGKTRFRVEQIRRAKIEDPEQSGFPFRMFLDVFLARPYPDVSLILI